MHRTRPSLTVLACCLAAASLAACSLRAGPAAPPASSTASQSWPCPLHTDGPYLSTPNGKHVTIHGANLPSLTDMENSAYKPDDRLRDLAFANARVVRLAVKFEEVTPTFVPAKIGPFIKQANDLGMLVILSWSGIITDPIDDRVDDAEDWLREEITYLSNNPGVWFDLYDGMQNVTPARQRSIAQRLVDVARGYRAGNILVVNNPAWLSTNDPQDNQPLTGENIVYGLTSTQSLSQTLGSGKNASRLTFMLTRFGDLKTPLSVDMDRVKSLNIDSAVAAEWVDTPNIPAYLSDFWKANRVNWSNCKK